MAGHFIYLTGKHWSLTVISNIEVGNSKEEASLSAGKSIG